uniref:Uncharacterized protein n=1 Tax=Tanacetum cinerariifolium TaxID=118510 RepID=A0A6L2LE16_TANCI|nr:hypothetical protein [Tanacetum cinerariifolium]
MQQELLQFKLQEAWTLVDLPYGKRDKQLDGLPTQKKKYDVSFHTKKVFANMKIIGQGFSEHASGNIAKTQTKATSIEPSSQGTSSGDSLMREDTMGNTSAHTRYERIVLDLEDELKGTKNAQQTKIYGLERRVKKLEKKHRLRTHKLKRLYKVSLTARLISSSDDETLDKKDTSKHGRMNEIDADEDISLVSTYDNVIQDEGIEDIVATAIADVSTTKTIVTTTLTITTESTKINVKAKVDADYQLAERLQAEEQEQLTDAEKAKLFMEFMEKRRKFFAVKRTVEKRNKPPTKAQQRSIMSTYLKNMDGWKPRALKNKSFTETKELFNKAMKRIYNFIDFRTELVEVSTKKDEAKTAQESSSKRA